jgi:hypothetical protein
VLPLGLLRITHKNSKVSLIQNAEVLVRLRPTRRVLADNPKISAEHESETFAQRKNVV